MSTWETHCVICDGLVTSAMSGLVDLSLGRSTEWAHDECVASQKAQGHDDHGCPLCGRVKPDGKMLCTYCEEHEVENERLPEKEYPTRKDAGID